MVLTVPVVCLKKWSLGFALTVLPIQRFNVGEIVYFGIEVAYRFLPHLPSFVVAAVAVS